METYEAIAAAIEVAGVKTYAKAVGCSAGYVYKMMRPCPTPGNPSATGEENFLDKVHAILARWIQGNIDTKPILEQICSRYGYGVYKRNFVFSTPRETLTQLVQFNVCVGACAARIARSIENGAIVEKESKEIETCLTNMESVLNTLIFSNQKYRQLGGKKKTRRTCHI